MSHWVHALSRDEGKPRCRNCVDRNFQCQYGPQLTFLSKNAHTIQASQVGTPSARYEAIRFINEEPQKDITEAEDDDMDEIPSHIDLPPHSQEAADTNPLSHPPRNEDMPSGSEEPVSHTANDLPSTAVLSDKDESAVAGLLALGTSMNGHDLGMADFTVSSPEVVTLTSSTIPSRLSHSRPAFSPQPMLPPKSPADELSPTETQALLRHYRYEVASWLDICDLGQSFGINALQVAMRSPAIWKSILDLSETSFNQLHTQNPRKEGSRSFSQFGDEDILDNITNSALLDVLDRVMDSISNISTAWTMKRHYNTGLLNALSSHAVGRDLNAAIYWLFARLDVGTALASDSDVQVPLPPTFPCLTEVDMVADPYEMVFYYAYRPLWLCAKAIHFMHNEEVSPYRPPLHTWMQLVEELEQWYRERPQEFQPMLELEMDDRLAGPERSFPVVLFANGAGLFGNQLYHTAMLLLLHNKPRTARITDFQSAAMSPLWHAQRVCSISLHNDRRECWDPCLLASFFVAARRMTHESQQQEVLRGFDRICTVTGWNAHDSVQGLRVEWGLLDET
ncbi:uncharacterized protein N7446_001488 [Penicillium canescens]|uniref:uncharacterized protein n=1 Tax=Penicillium canescens TaxID=5083 RepID=UPI0026DF01E4|nr:uncharacterized protein N7446_001488 [Penicillium canescens]KAJ6054767.1 hypothetical protein N7444_003865 [Penicillium canescens]KAJ6073711.1 hypothetical protein N7446_001488 [Penicillium canescens]